MLSMKMKSRKQITFSRVWGWGYNHYGQLGHSDQNVVLTPTLVRNLQGLSVKQMFCGSYVSFALTNDGQVYMSGHLDSSVIMNTAFTRIESLCGIGIVDIAVGCCGHVLTLNEHKQVHVMGSNDYSQLGLMGTYDDQQFAVKMDTSNYGQIVQVAVGGRDKLGCSYLLNDDGQVYSWGCGEHFTLGHGDNDDREEPDLITRLKNVKSLIVGSYHCVAMTSDGKLYGWGRTPEGQLFGISRWGAQYVDIPIDLSTLFQGKTFVGWQLSEEAVDLSKNLRKLVISDRVTMALTLTGKVKSWGVERNYGGVSPVQNVVLEDIDDISCGDKIYLALNSKGAVYQWGAKSGSPGFELDSERPNTLKSLSNIKRVVCYGMHCFALE
ncbi:E3 ubiquitin-protein ligase HERC [Acrasis kona]|uniref:E3 ubiquitin-protein ligase HERC n=1 Tax=Acrasis kona TaxID=1008807 RepID=A0AAW2YI43_9EUKA